MRRVTNAQSQPKICDSSNCLLSSVELNEEMADADAIYELGWKAGPELSLALEQLPLNVINGE